MWVIVCNDISRSFHFQVHLCALNLRWLVQYFPCKEEDVWFCIYWKEFRVCVSVCVCVHLDTWSKEVNSVPSLSHCEAFIWIFVLTHGLHFWCWCSCFQPSGMMIPPELPLPILGFKQPMIPFTHSFSHLVTMLSASLIRLYFMRDSSGISAPEKPVSNL